MIYPKNKSESLDLELFKNPTSEYRGAPFWSWNSHLEKDRLKKQIKIFKKMGFGGFHMHSRTGLEDKYLGTTFMDAIRFCTDIAEKEKMLSYLYDDDRWPSGAAGGLISVNPENQAKFLMFTAEPIEEKTVSFNEAYHTGAPCLYRTYDVFFNKDGIMQSYKIINTDDTPEGVKRYAYIFSQPLTQWYNGYTYGNTLDKSVMQEFVDMTHEKYKKTVGDKFGTTIKTIFADESQYTMKLAAQSATLPCRPGQVPWSMDFEEDFFKRYGYSITERLPELFAEYEDTQMLVTRLNFHNFLTDRFVEGFAETCSYWCEKNGIELTGHLAAEDTLEGQNKYCGDIMRSLKFYGIPGIDILLNDTHLNTAKMAQSICHQYGKEGVLSELYGVMYWDFDFRGHKYQGDWQAALGITLRVPHLSMLSMAGEAKRDYPASISYQSPWYQKYPVLENHYARLNTALTRGTPMVDIAVIHPIESYYLFFGPDDKTIEKRRAMDLTYKNIGNWLLNGALDFDFINEALLPSLSGEITNRLTVGKMKYKTVIVPDCATLRQSTVDLLRKFSENGGNVIFLGKYPHFIDAIVTNESIFRGIGPVIELERDKILEALQSFKTIDIRTSNGVPTDNLIYNHRLDNDCEWLFIAHGVKPSKENSLESQNITVTLNGTYLPKLFDTYDGTVKDIEFENKDCKTVIFKTLNQYDSILIRLTPSNNSTSLHIDKKAYSKETELNIEPCLNYTRDEKNVLLLDMAKYRLDNGAWKDREEILRLDNECRKELGYQLRGQVFAQPWAVKPEPITHNIELFFEIDSRIEANDIELALENAENAQIKWNNRDIKNDIIGYFVDSDIKRVKLPPLIKGINTLSLTLPFGRRTNTEWCYILGDFDVYVKGDKAYITECAKKLSFGDTSKQGLAFYGGNLSYKLSVKTSGDALAVQIPEYIGALIEVIVDEKNRKNVIYPPYTVIFDDLPAGQHDIEIKLFGTRTNTFGAVHHINNADGLWKWYDPMYWRSVNQKWTYDYILRANGIMTPPIIKELHR